MAHRFIITMLVGLASSFITSVASAQNVSLNGVMGTRALLVIDGTTRMMSAGSTERGVRLIAITPNDVTVEIDGRRATLAVGGSPVNLTSAASGKSGGGSQIVMNATTGGHFGAGGSINGRSVQFLVDTGASLVTMSQDTANRIGLDYRKGEAIQARTANGIVSASRTELDVVRVGEVDIYNVEAVVIPTQMDVVLLGNSFLSRFQMRRDNDQMTLSKRF